jgi:hypothetical protein
MVFLPQNCYQRIFFICLYFFGVCSCISGAVFISVHDEKGLNVKTGITLIVTGGMLMFSAFLCSITLLDDSTRISKRENEHLLNEETNWRL